MKAVQKLVSYPPNSVGLLGCFWTDSSTIEWFEDFFLLKGFVAKSDSDYSGHFFSNSGLKNEDETEISQNEFFSMQSNHYVPYGIFIYIFVETHYESLIRPWNKVSPIFWIGEPIPDSICKLYNINKEKWDAVTLDDVHTHNLKIKEIRQ